MFLGRSTALVLGAFAIGFVVAIVSIATKRNAIRREVEESVEAWHKHGALVGAERAASIAQLADVRRELDEGSTPAWAGEYSWRFDTRHSCGCDPTREYEEGLVLAPHAGAVWWYGTSGIQTAEFVDHRRVVSVDDEHVVIEWKIAPHSPHRQRLFERTLVMGDDWIRVQRDRGEFLVPAVRMPLFCAPKSSWLVANGSLAPRKFGWDATRYVRGYCVGSESDPDSFDVPRKWRDY